MPAGEVVLHQFPHSHFNEKARFALDWKSVAHRRVGYLPGPHALYIQRLSGQRSTPVLELDGERVAGSASILDALERRFPERPLYPRDPRLRDQALELQRELDAEVGPAVRTVIFSVLIREADYLCALFSTGKTAWVRALYRGAFPLTRPLMASANGVTDAAGIARAFERTERALDFVAVGTAGRRFLVGDAFSVADLAAAALLAPLANPAHPDMRLPEPMPESVRALLARFSARPAIAWVRETYARERTGAAAGGSPRFGHG